MPSTGLDTPHQKCRATTFRKDRHPPSRPPMEPSPRPPATERLAAARHPPTFACARRLQGLLARLTPRSPQQGERRVVDITGRDWLRSSNAAHCVLRDNGVRVVMEQRLVPPISVPGRCAYRTYGLAVTLLREVAAGANQQGSGRAISARDQVSRTSSPRAKHTTLPATRTRQHRDRCPARPSAGFLYPHMRSA